MEFLFVSLALLLIMASENVNSMETIVKPDLPRKLQVSGKIKFEGKEPDNFPAGSWLTVTIQDTSIADAPSTDIAMYQAEIKDYNKVNNPLTYSIKDIANPPLLLGIPDISISAHISIGGKRTNIKQQDYLTMTMHSLVLKENTFMYTDQDITVEKYE